MAESVFAMRLVNLRSVTCYTDQNFKENAHFGALNLYMPIPLKLVRELSLKLRYCSDRVPQTEKPLECWHYLATCLSVSLIDYKTDALVHNNNTK